MIHPLKFNVKIKYKDINMLKKITILTMLFTLNLNATPFDAVNSSAVSQLASKFNIESNAKILGLSQAAYQHAVEQLIRLEFGTVDTGLKKLPELIDFKKLDKYSDSELTNIMKQQRTTLANYLSIPVEKLQTFYTLVPENLLQNNGQRDN